MATDAGSAAQARQAEREKPGELGAIVNDGGRQDVYDYANAIRIHRGST